MSCDFIQTQTSLSQNHQIWSPLQRSKVPAFFFGIVFSGQLVIVLITIQFYQGSHAFPYRSLQPEAEWESSMSQYARVYMCVCASVHVHTHTHTVTMGNYPALSAWKSYCNMEEMQTSHSKAFKTTCSVFICQVRIHRLCCDEISELMFCHQHDFS